MLESWVNLSFYRFLNWEKAELPLIQQKLKRLCGELSLKGTVLLAQEGINAMVSGRKPSTEAFKSHCQADFQIPGDAFKQTRISEHSFQRMLVKIKKEIISVGDPGLKPHEKTAHRLSPSELKAWLDQRKEVILLDTRNDYEIEVGTFRGAIDFKLTSSREFSKKAEENLERLKNKPVVTFCTGGIRCEKASAMLLKLGLKEVYQLNGGILRYFEENGSEHFQGNCFVFDGRLSVDGQLASTARSSDPHQEFGRHLRRNRPVSKRLR